VREYILHIIVIEFGTRIYEIDLIIIRFNGNQNKLSTILIYHNSPINSSFMYCKYIKIRT
jgi:hypothetical protein